MRAEDKIAMHIIGYGENRSGVFDDEDDRGRVILDKELWAEVIYYTIKEQSGLGEEKYDIVLDNLEQHYLIEDVKTGYYYLRYVPDGTFESKVQPIFLQLCYVVFVLNNGGMKLFKGFLEACLYDGKNIKNDSIDKVENLINLLQGYTNDDLINLYKLNRSWATAGCTLIRSYWNKQLSYLENYIRSSKLSKFYEGV